MFNRIRQYLSGCLGLCLFLVMTGSILACPEPEDTPVPQKKGRIKVTMVVILGSKKPGKTHTCLRDLAKRVRKQYPELKHFHVESMSSESVAVDQKTLFKLVEEKSAVVTIHHGANNNNKVKLSVRIPGCLGELVYRSKCGPFLPIVTCHQTKDGQRLILAVRVQPCNKTE